MQTQNDRGAPPCCRHDWICFFSSANKFKASMGFRLSRSALSMAFTTSAFKGVKIVSWTGPVSGASGLAAKRSLRLCSVCSWRERISRARQ